MASDALSTRIKAQLNVLLGAVGLQIGTTAELTVERARVRSLQAGDHWRKARYDQGLRFDDEKHLQFLRETCLPYKSSYANFARSPNGNDQEFYLDNGYFRSIDAELLYSVIRRYRPKHIIEVGSGFSTRLMARAIREEKGHTTITSIDPEPRVPMSAWVTEQILAGVENMNPDLIVDSLGEGDVLFIDSSHSVLVGGDVPFLFLEVLPRLKAGVLIHIHDIFLPFDYPEEWTLNGWYWTEQYLVHAFLAFNHAFEILWPARYMWAYHESAVANVIPAEASIIPPSSLWLKKVS